MSILSYNLYHTDIKQTWNDALCMVFNVSVPLNVLPRLGDTAPQFVKIASDDYRVISTTPDLPSGLLGIKAPSLTSRSAAA